MDIIVSCNSSRKKRRLSKSERTRQSQEIFCRKGSKILPDFFPPDKQKKEIFNHQVSLSTKRIDRLAKQYSWEIDENGHSEAQAIFESWMKYFGLDRGLQYVMIFRN